MPDKNSLDFVKLSKTLSRALRHAPHEYSIELGHEGWVELESLLVALRPRRKEWAALSEADIAALIAAAEKPRFQLQEGKIRATHGHSTQVRLEYVPVVPPEVLYHGTSAEAMPIILQDGLKPMRRQYVHLSNDQTMAQKVGNRKGGQTVLLRIKAGDAHRDGVVFYKPNTAVWLCKFIPPHFIEREA